MNKQALLRRQSLISSSNKVSTIKQQQEPTVQDEEATTETPQKCTMCAIMWLYKFNFNNDQLFKQDLTTGTNKGI